MTNEDVPARRGTGSRAVIPPEVRESMVRELSTHFARDHIGVEELERRLDRAYAATSVTELRTLTSDLPGLADQPGGLPEAARYPSSAGQHGLDVSDGDLVIAIMGGAERRGQWTPPRRLTVVTIMGGAEIDLREATFGVSVTEIFVIVIMGGVEIITAPGTRLDVSGLAIMGGFEGGASAGNAGSAGGAHHPDAPVVKVRGFAMMGGVGTSVRLPGESEKDAKKRLKAEREARRKLSKPS